MKKGASRSFRQAGAVSLFVVVFAAMLLTVVTVSFVRTMVQDQMQASAQDLSQSAYDSAQAGVQDAIRAVLQYVNACNDSEQATRCSEIRQTIPNWNNCNAALGTVSGIQVTNGEVAIQQLNSSDADASLDQAYTCVKVNMDVDNVLGQLQMNQTKIIPLVSLGDFSSLRLNWYSRDDVNDPNNPPTSLTFPQLNGSNGLVSSDVWNKTNNVPPMIRAQIIILDEDGFTLNDFNTTEGSSTVFLYPATSGTQSVDFPARLSASAAQPIASACLSSIPSGGYACGVDLKLPESAGGGTKKVAYLQIEPLYASTSFEVVLKKDGADGPSFNGVQVEIDSTGRANDLFRRVSTRVDLMNNSFPFPASSLNVSAGNFCKNFAVTNSTDDYAAINAGNTCTP